MAKKIVIFFIFLSSLFAQTNIYEQNCVSCHKGLSITLEKFFFKYLLKYSSERNVKSALIDFLKDPNYYTSVLSPELINTYGIKSKTDLTDAQLQEAIDIYWEKYKVFGKIK